MLPCDGSWGCDLGRGQYRGATFTGAGGLCLALPSRAPLRCGELEGGIIISHQDAEFGIEVSHGLLLAKVCRGSTCKPPHSSSLECEMTPNPLGHGTLWTRLPLLGQVKGAGRSMGVRVLSAKK